jgi:DhnA family fructose-bisphosphate aldolase class Ia
LGTTSAYTWLKLPVVDDMAAVLDATTLPVLLLGGELAADPDSQLATWRKALASPSVRGMVVGRSLLFPPDGNVAAAVDATVELL